MITVLIGGGEDEKVSLSNFCRGRGRNTLLNASTLGSFPLFCQMAVNSTNTLNIPTEVHGVYKEVTANDDMIVFFPKDYISKLEIPLIYKLATVLEVGIDLGLNVQAFAFTGQKDWNPGNLPWPTHWPSVLYYSKEKDD